MKDSRKGEALWLEWDGYNFDQTLYPDNSLVFYTEEHIDMENEIVRRALASSIQRSGSASSLNQGFIMVDTGHSSQTYAGYIDGDVVLTICDADGLTHSGDTVDEVLAITMVEVSPL
jgi:hypothetical protein